MKLSPGEKLITLMLCDLFTKLEIESDFDPEFVSEAIRTGNLWALGNTYVGIATEDNEITDDVVRTVHNTFDMYRTLEESVASFSDAEKAELLKLAPIFGKDLGWPGFDGNNEGEYRRAARFMLEKMDYHSHFKDRADLNSHSQTIETTDRMIDAYKALRSKAAFGRNLSVEEVAEIVNAQTYPSMP